MRLMIRATGIIVILGSVLFGAIDSARIYRHFDNKALPYLKQFIRYSKLDSPSKSEKSKASHRHDHISAHPKRDGVTDKMIQSKLKELYQYQKKQSKQPDPALKKKMDSLVKEIHDYKTCRSKTQPHKISREEFHAFRKMSITSARFSEMGVTFAMDSDLRCAIVRTCREEKALVQTGSSLPWWISIVGTHVINRVTRKHSLIPYMQAYDFCKVTLTQQIYPPGIYINKYVHLSPDNAAYLYISQEVQKLADKDKAKDEIFLSGALKTQVEQQLKEELTKKKNAVNEKFAGQKKHRRFLEHYNELMDNILNGNRHTKNYEFKYYKDGNSNSGVRVELVPTDRHKKFNVYRAVKHGHYIRPLPTLIPVTTSEHWLQDIAWGLDYGKSRPYNGSLIPDNTIPIALATFGQSLMMQGFTKAIAGVGINAGTMTAGHLAEKHLGVDSAIVTSAIAFLRKDYASLAIGKVQELMDNQPKRFQKKFKHAKYLVNYYAATKEIAEVTPKSQRFLLNEELQEKVAISQDLEKRLPQDYVDILLDHSHWEHLTSILKDQSERTQLAVMLKAVAQSDPKLEGSLGTREIGEELLRLFQRHNVPDHITASIFNSLDIDNEHLDQLPPNIAINQRQQIDEVLMKAGKKGYPKIAVTLPEQTAKAVFKTHQSGPLKVSLKKLGEKLDGHHLHRLPWRHVNVVHAELSKTLRDQVLNGFKKIPTQHAKTIHLSESEKADIETILTKAPKWNAKKQTDFDHVGQTLKHKNHTWPKAKRVVDELQPQTLLSLHEKLREKLCENQPKSIAKILILLPKDEKNKSLETLPYEDVTIAFGGKTTTTQGHSREFQSPPIDPCNPSYYDVQISYKQKDDDGNWEEKTWQTNLPVLGGNTTIVRWTPEYEFGVEEPSLPLFGIDQGVMDSQTNPQVVYQSPPHTKKKQVVKSKTPPQIPKHHQKKTKAQPPSTPKTPPNTKSCKNEPHQAAKVLIQLPISQSGYPYHNIPYNRVDISIDGNPRSRGGALRRFVTPPLDPCYSYYYTVRITWTQFYQGRFRRYYDERRVRISAGRTTYVRLSYDGYVSARTQ